MRGRITTWVALLAMVSGLGLPLHAYAHLARAGGPGSDLCVAGKASTGAPMSPEREHVTACDMCCGCATTGAASPPTTRDAVVPATFIAINHAARSMRSASPVGSALPRGPPPFA